MKANFYKYNLEFIRPSGTSRGILHTKETFILEISHQNKKGIGECAIFRGLSCDDIPNYEEKLIWLTENINSDYDIIKEKLKNYPSIWIGYEQAILNLKQTENLYFPSEFTERKDSLKINGLIWMGTTHFMIEQIQQKLRLGFDCLKLKIGTDWQSEKEILKELRKNFSKEDLELRVDANGAFTFEETKKVLNELHKLEIHSIEQPIKAGNWENMKQLCAETPTPIALDEELIGINDYSEKKELIEQIKPQFIILKPSLCGGFSGSDEWISLAEQENIGWWITSALESNIGLNAIAQYTYTKTPKMPQGLGTGALFKNNFGSSLNLQGDRLSFK